MRSLGSSDSQALDSAAGWYRDSENERLHRYWDGGQWRSETGESPQQRGLAPVEAIDPLPAPVRGRLREIFSARVATGNAGPPRDEAT